MTKPNNKKRLVRAWAVMHRNKFYAAVPTFLEAMGLIVYRTDIVKVVRVTIHFPKKKTAPKKSGKKK